MKTTFILFWMENIFREFQICVQIQKDFYWINGLFGWLCMFESAFSVKILGVNCSFVIMDFFY